MDILHTLFSAIAPLALAVVVGFFCGKTLLSNYSSYAAAALTPVVWAILWVIGISTGEVLGSMSQGLHAMKQGTTYALATSLAILLVFIPFFSIQPATVSESTSLWETIWPPLKESLIAFSLVGFGVYCSSFQWVGSELGQSLININLWLWVLLFLIGVELTKTKFSRQWLSPTMLAVPMLAILASLLAGALVSLFNGEKLTTALALSSGFGWFSLSGALASQHLGESYAAIALFTDLMRELLGILIVFMLGARLPKSSIAVCGATAADTTLPFIRKACGADYVPLALMTGLVLTLVGPFLMLIFMKL